LPKDFPSYHLVNYYYNKWTHSGLLEQLNAALRARLRQQKGRNPDPYLEKTRDQEALGEPQVHPEIQGAIVLPAKATLRE